MISTPHMLICSNLGEEKSCFPIAAGQTHLILDTRLISSPPINIVQLKIQSVKQSSGMSARSNISRNTALGGGCGGGKQLLFVSGLL